VCFYGCHYSCPDVIGGGSDSPLDTFSRLDGIRDQKIEEIQGHYQGLHNAAQEIVHDELMMDFFREHVPAPDESPAD